MADERLSQILKRIVQRLAGTAGEPGLPQAAEVMADRLDRLGTSATHTAELTKEEDSQVAPVIEQSLQRPAITGSRTRTDTDLDRVADEQFNDSANTGSGADSSSRPHPLQGLWLERRVRADTSIDPFTSIMDLPHDEAQRIANEMGKRFDGDYVTYRQEVESWLRSKAVQKGNPSSDSPLYFKLLSEQGSTYPLREGSAVIRIPAESIPVEHLTLTVDDSFFNYQSLTGAPASNTPDGLVPQVISGQDADDALDFEGQHRDFLLAANSGRYIEAQVWSRDDPILAEARRQFQAGIPADRIITVTPSPQSAVSPDNSKDAT